MLPPQAASSLTIAPLNMQPPLHLPATATQTAASEALLDLWDNGDPSGMGAIPLSVFYRIFSYLYPIVIFSLWSLRTLREIRRQCVT